MTDVWVVLGSWGGNNDEINVVRILGKLILYHMISYVYLSIQSLERILEKSFKYASTLLKTSSI